MPQASGSDQVSDGLVLDSDIFDDLFQACALHAYLDVAQTHGEWPPDVELTRRRAYELYEELLAERLESKS